jgi:hypothetical protein
MTPDLPPDDIDQQIRINELKHRAEELAGGELFSHENPDAPPDVVESFWDHVVRYEEAEWTSQFEQLAEGGYVPPHPDDLTTDEQVHAALWELIRRLAARRTFLSHTDHLSDRELYEHLVFESLHERQKDVDIPDMNCHLDVLGGCSEEDIENSMRYYADDEYRAQWQKDFPEYHMPAKVKPPFDRDRLLPKARYD